MTPHGSPGNLVLLVVEVAVGFPGRRPWRTEATRDYLKEAVEKDSACGGGRGVYQTTPAP